MHTITTIDTPEPVAVDAVRAFSEMTEGYLIDRAQRAEAA